MILAISPEGVLTSHTGVKNFLKFAYETIGCDLAERVALPGDLEMWLDEEGSFRQKINHYAMTAAIVLAGELRQPLFGTVIITGPGNSDIPMPDEKLAELKRTITGK